MYVMGKKRNNNKNGILAIHLNPVDIVLLDTGKTRDGNPVMTEVRKLTERWLNDIQHFSMIMDSRDEDTAPKEFLDYANEEAELFAGFILDTYKPRYLTLPAYQEIETIMSPADESYSRFTFLLTTFGQTLHDMLFSEAEMREIHILLVPFVGELHTMEIDPTLNPAADPMAIIKYVLMFMRNESEGFLRNNRCLPGSATVLDIDSDTAEKKHDYRNSDILVVHFHPDAFAYVKENGKVTECYTFLESMDSSTEELSDREIDEMESYIEDIFDNHPSCDVLCIEPDLSTDEKGGMIPCEHLEAIVDYSVESFIQEAISREMHVIVLPYLDMDEIMEETVEPIRKLLPIKTVARNEIYMEILSKNCAAFLKENSYLPGIATIL